MSEDTSTLPVPPLADDSNSHFSGEKTDPLESELSFSVQQENISSILHYTFDQPNESFEFVYNIWADTLGSDTFNPTLYENGLVDHSISVNNGVGASLFTRIGNLGNNESNLDYTLNDHYSNISAGWQIQFPIQSSYDMINISFKWRFDTPDGGFDNYNDFEGEERDFEKLLDPTPDYQEIRCRITHDETSQSFWLGNPIDSSNPNGTIYYRIGLNVTQDEIWHPFKYSFLVGSQSSNYTLELGAYLNTREYYNEYFDVWFDDIRILGLSNVSDSTPPLPSAIGLERTQNISRFKFWTNFSEGTWESSIENVTVFYDLNGVSLNGSLTESSEFEVNSAGYNQTTWFLIKPLSFNDIISYNFKIFDTAGNTYTTKTLSTVIGDYSPPDISSVDIIDNGKGVITVNIITSDWGYGVDSVKLNYTIDEGIEKSTDLIGDEPFYHIDLPINYSSTLKFGITLTDKIAGNWDFHPGSKFVSDYPIVADNDTVEPEILDYTITPSLTTEGRTNVTVFAGDEFGKIEKVYLEVYYENGTPHEKYSRVTLQNSSVPGLFKLRKMEGESALKLPYKESYSIKFIVEDIKGNNDTLILSENWVVPDILSPKVADIEIEYLYPGRLGVWVQASDLGSGIKTVILERNVKGGQFENITMDRKNNRYYKEITTGLFGNEEVSFRINARDNEGNEIEVEKRPTVRYVTKIFFTTSIGLLISELLVVTAVVSIFTTIKVIQRQQLRALRRRRFDVALRRSEQLAYLGEEAIFGFLAAYSQSEGVSSSLLWEPSLIGHFYQYLKELIDKANNNVSFIMQTKAQDLVTYVDFKIEQIGCSAITFAYPVATLPQQWLSALTLDQVPSDAGQGVLLLMLLMREKWAEISHDFQDEITEGVLELKNLILSGEEKDLILQRAREFRLFISGTVEVLDEIEVETEEISADVLGDFESEFLDMPEDDSFQDEADDFDNVDDV